MKWAKLIPKTVSVPPFPKITQDPSRKSMLARSLIAASTHTDKKEVAWLNGVEGFTFEALGDPGEERFKFLDQVLAPALMKLILLTQLRLDINQQELTAMENGTSISGREVIYLIYQWFATDEYMSTVYGLHDLTEGDKPSEMQRFLQYCDNILKSLEDRTAVNDKSMRDLLYRQVKKSTVLKEGVAEPALRGQAMKILPTCSCGGRSKGTSPFSARNGTW